MGKRTPLYDQHVAAGAKIVDFSAWDMPLHYGSQVAEHERVRNDAGMFDVSHMTLVDLSGGDTRGFLRRVLANNIDRLKAPGKALYSCMLREDGGVLDDLIVYFLGDDAYRVVFNAATREKVLAWITPLAISHGVSIAPRSELAMVAVQGPRARDAVHALLSREHALAAETLLPFTAAQMASYFIARTGYTGEDGYEIMLPAQQAPQLWAALLAAGVQPVGLGARDTLRLEAGMNLYGTDMDETTTPLESGLAWTVAWEPADRDFIGRAALQRQRDGGGLRQFVGLILLEKGVLRNHQTVTVDGRVAGEITSGSFSPTLGRAIAFARLTASAGQACCVDIRGRMVPARVVRPPFVRRGKPCSSVADLQVLS
jgi:aminomethyltransferase